MLPRHFTDPLGSKLPALERNILKLRAFQMVLVMFYAEQLKRTALDMIQTTDSARKRFGAGESYVERAPKNAKRQVEKALNALVADGTITADDKAEIVSLIDYRNTIGHHLHELLIDVSPERYAKEIQFFRSDRLKAFDYTAVDRLRHFLDHLNNGRHYVRTITMDGLLFEASGRVYLSEIKVLKRKIKRLHKERQQDIKALNTELDLKGTWFDSDDHFPDHPLHKYDNNRLTHRGVEACYRLYDLGRSPMAVAHLMGIALASARKRQRTWLSKGGRRRESVDYDSLPRRKFYRRYDD